MLTHVTTSTSLLHHLTTTYLNTSPPHHITTLNNLFNLLCDIVEALCRFESSHYHSALVDEELGEVPLDIALLLVVRVGLAEHLVEDWGEGMALVPAGKTALLLQETEERVGIVAVDLDLPETGEVGTVGEFAEIVDRLIGTGGLLAKLVAGEIEDFKALGVIFLIEGFEFLILRSKATW